MKRKMGKFTKEVTVHLSHLSNIGFFPPSSYFRLSASINFPFFISQFIPPLTPSSMQQVISIWVRDPRIQKNDFWHAYIDYEICLHVSRTNKWTVLTPSVI